MQPLVFVFSLLFPLALGASQAEPSVTLPPELSRVLSDYESAWGAKDAVALSGLFAKDGLVLAPGHPMVRGRGAIQAFYEGRGGPLFLRAVAYATEGPVGYLIGGFAHKAGDPDTGKFTLTLQKDAAGRWFIVSDMDNGNSER